MNEKYEPQDLSHVPTEDLVALMRGCGFSHHPTDKAFAKQCRDEIAKRKPATQPQGGGA